MGIHPSLWPALVGAAIGLPIVLIGALWLFRRWAKLSGPLRWTLFAALALFEAAYWLNIYAWFVEPNMLVVHRVTVMSEQWHGPPLTIAAIGDTHVASPHVDVRRMERVVRRINALRPDLVVLLGDYVGSHEPRAERSDAENNEILNGLATFAALGARYGVVAVIGNHDDWYDRAAVTRALEAAGVAVLVDRHIVIRRASGPLLIAGLDDEMTGAPNYAAAVDGAGDARGPLTPGAADTLAIMHSPDSFSQIPRDVALTLAAHTHCGQVTVPFVGRPFIPSAYGQRYACHRIDEEGRTMFVTGGIGTSVVPIRFLNPPEIALITLRAAD